MSPGEVWACAAGPDIVQLRIASLESRRSTRTGSIAETSRATASHIVRESGIYPGWGRGQRLS